VRKALLGQQQQQQQQDGAGADAGASSSGGGGGSLTNNELLRRLRETQALLIKFSEENSRLSSDNQRLQAGRNALSVEHASVLDEIDLLRGKLSQLEHSVLSAAGAATAAQGGAGGSAGAGADGPAAAAAAAATGTAAATGGRGGGLDMRALLQSLGLGEEVVQALSAVGVGPAGGLSEPADDQAAAAAGGVQRAGAQQSGAWQVAAGGAQQPRGMLLQQSSALSAHSDRSSSPSRPAPGALSASCASTSSSRQAPVSAGRSSPVGASNLGPGRSASPLPGSAKGSTPSIIKRTPLHNKAAVLEPRDDSITLGNPASLAVLLGGAGGGKQAGDSGPRTSL
jgi:hypothetical protein